MTVQPFLSASKFPSARIGLSLAVYLGSGCLAEKEYIENECTPHKSTLALIENAARKAQSPYEAPVVPECAPLDRPPDGNEFGPGIVFEEYAAMISGTSGNFLDNGTWWGKALPRGELHIQPTKLYDENCSVLDYDHFQYDYAALTPAVSSVPECGRALVGLSIGHRFFQSNPQVLELDATSYARLVPLKLNTIFGTSFRLATENAAHAGETFPALEEIHLLRHDADSLSVAATVSGRSVEGAFEAELVPGASSQLRVNLTLYRRTGADPKIRIGVFGMSSMFWKRDDETPDQPQDEAHDCDEFVVHFADGTGRTVPLENPPRTEIPDSWTRHTFSGPALQGSEPDGAALASVTLRQSERDFKRYLAYESARYAERPTMHVEILESNAPLVAELSVSHADSEYIDNVVASVFVDPSFSFEEPVHVRYVLSATPD
ncbi:MAG TPA: glucan biosynthesis protein [Polyangiaceae bacterium]|nr:glucan biosynthesis protein [Polyangiaceae bacterium]